MAMQRQSTRGNGKKIYLFHWFLATVCTSLAMSTQTVAATDPRNKFCRHWHNTLIDTNRKTRLALNNGNWTRLQGVQATAIRAGKFAIQLGRQKSVNNVPAVLLHMVPGNFPPPHKDPRNFQPPHLWHC
jgi:hypothetical protein